MKMNLKVVAFIACSLSVVCGVVSCDSSYDMTKYDPTVSVGQGLEIPINVVETLSLTEYAHIDLGQHTLYGKDVPISIPAIPDVSKMPEKTTTDFVTLNTMTIHQDFGIFPNWISTLKSIDGKSKFDAKLSFPDNKVVGKLYLQQGLRIEYPEWIHIGKCSDSNFIIAENGHQLILTKDFSIKKNSEHHIEIEIDRFSFSTNPIDASGFTATGSVNVKGVAYYLREDLSESASPVTLNSGFTCFFDKVDVDSTQIAIDTSRFGYEVAMENIDLDLGKRKVDEFSVVGHIYNDNPLSFKLKTTLSSPENVAMNANDIIVDANSEDEHIINVKTENGAYVSKINSIDFLVKISDYNGQLITFSAGDEVIINVNYIKLGERGMIL